MSSDPTIFIVDTDPNLCQTIAGVASAMQWRAEGYDSAEKFLKDCASDRPGCLVVEDRLPGLSGLELLAELRRRGPSLPTIMLSARPSVERAVRAMRAGALNFLEKPCPTEQLQKAIQEAIGVDADNRRHLVLVSRVGQRLSRLNPGEQQVLELLWEGQSNKEIASRLGLSIRAVEARRSKLMEKMRAESLAKLIRMVVATRSLIAGP